MGVRLRDEVIASFQRVAVTEWWVVVDLLAAIAGYAVWVAGSAALGVQAATLADYGFLQGDTPTTPVLALAGLLWIVLPAVLGVARVRTRLLNIRDNLEKVYRIERPGALLVFPAAVLAVLGAVAVLMGTIDPLLFLVLAPATLYLLVRTIAFSCRVYAFSHPSIPYVFVFATLAVQTGVVLLYLGLATENGPVVRATVDALGLPFDPLATISIGPLSAPAGPLFAVLVPIGLVGTYVTLQYAAASIARFRDPTITPSRVRTGQRYPPRFDVESTTRRPSSGNTSPTETPASTVSDESTDIPSSGSASSSTSGNGDGPAGTSSTAASSPSASNEAAANEAADDEAAVDDTVSHTRVFTPPGGEDDQLDDGSIEDRECSDCGATVPVDAGECPACGVNAP